MGQTIRDNESYDSALYTDFLLWAGDIIVEAQKLIHDSLEISDRWETNLPAGGIRVIERIPVRLTGRPKTLDTTREKLRRMPDFKLSRIQDISGVRLDGDYSLSQQDLIADRLQHAFKAAGARTIKLEDLRDQTRHGYRALHINAAFPAGRLEVQIRTKLQSAWANAYELLGDVYGREIRYAPPSSGPISSLITAYLSISDSAYLIDEAIDSINKSALDVAAFMEGLSTESLEWKIQRNELLHILGLRSLTFGGQIDVVDSLDEMRDQLLVDRAGHRKGEA